MPAQPTCPNCRKPSVAEHKPFCSARCKQLDLGRWLTGQYAVPAQEEDQPDDESEG